MLNEAQAAKIIQDMLDKFNVHYIPYTKVIIKTCITYDFGWFFENKVKGETLIGGPDYGTFVHKNGHQYGLHYVGFPWDTGIGDHLLNFQGTKEINGVMHPTNLAIRYFLKQTQMLNGEKGKTFKTTDGYDLENAIKFLKLNICMPLEKARKWISKDSGINIDPQTYPIPNHEAYYNKFTDFWHSIVNTGLDDQNWQQYYSKTI